MNKNHCKKWTEEDIELIRNYCNQNISTRDISIKMGRTFKAVQHIINGKLKIKRKMYGSLNPMWKNKDIKKTSLHSWINRHKPKPLFCESCLTINSEPIDLANISGKYIRDVDDFVWLCRTCHMVSDGRILNLNQYKFAINPEIRQVLTYNPLVKEAGHCALCSGKCDDQLYIHETCFLVLTHIKKNILREYLKQNSKGVKSI